jgi:hypothetical protein
MVGKRPDPAAVDKLLRTVGLNAARDWLYLDYCTWAGPIDSVFGLGVTGGRAFGPVNESADDQVAAAYLSLMAEFGVRPADALRFPPFVRGFWGES